jgi:ornithine cyclodeaminase
LADPHADTLAMVGTGKQALAQVAAVTAVRPLAMVRIHSPNPEHREAFADTVRGELGLAVEEAGSVDEASVGAGIVTTATRARTPFLGAEMVGQDTHVNAIGAITPERREITDDLVVQAGLVAADSPTAARDLSAELNAAQDVAALSAVVTGAARRPEGTASVFKAMGIGLADVAVGAAVLEAAERVSVGRPLPRRERSAPQLRGGDHDRTAVS